MLTIVESALLGIIQGFTEWLPISSSGQLTLLLINIIGILPATAYGYSIASHLGTALSGVFILKKEFMDAIKGGRWMRIMLVPLISGVPVAYIIQKTLTTLNGDYLNALIGLMLIITAILLMLPKQREERTIWDISTLELLALGIVQGIAVIPGLSRSGITIALLLIMKFRPVDAVKASFITGIAATGLAALYELIQLSHSYVGLVQISVTTLTSFVAGIISAGIMLNLALRYNEKIAYFAGVIGIIALVGGLLAFV